MVDFVFIISYYIPFDVLSRGDNSIEIQLENSHISISYKMVFLNPIDFLILIFRERKKSSSN